MTNEEAHELFAYEHLPPHLQLISRRYHNMMLDILANYERSFQRDAVLQKLLEAKDAHVRLAAQKEKK